MINEDILEKIVSFIDLKGKNIIEVGPGYGALTEKLLLKGISAIDLVELDKKMVEILEDRIKTGDFNLTSSKLRLNNIDILKYEPIFDDYLVIANIPYYITSPILFRFLYDIPNKPTEMIILMQKDVADKIRKIKGNKSSVLSLYVEYKCVEVKEIIKVGPGNFIPPPKVESSVLYFKLRDVGDNALDKHFIDMIKLGFSEKRKKLISNLSKRFDHNKVSAIFDLLGLSENTRAEELSLDIWIRLVENMIKI
ncbi:MAG: rRNA adenine dimethyltransferase family protein [Candidatus Gracilibacteria bacterium]|nr:rRNA adenine dimethyltransferase family protein [Candidatus Gracilibacteria bacterium]